MILQTCFELLDHFGGLLNGDFDAPKFVKLIRFKLFSNRVAQFAAAQADDAQLVENIVGHAVYG